MPALSAIGLGFDTPCFVIAEAGVNHNGRLDLALKLVDAAFDAGADAVKFQTWITEKLVSPQAEIAAYQRENTGRDDTQFTMLKALELGWEDFRKIKSYCDKKGILFLSTPDEEDSADFLETLNIPLFKIGSAELDNFSFLRHIARKGRTIVLSTGMATLDEVREAVHVIRSGGNPPLVLLQCVSDYPAVPSACNLRVMETLAHEFACPVGFSDHTRGINVSLAAAALGACVIEKHLTLDKAMEGPDHRCSLEPGEFTSLVKGIREVESALGTGIKVPTDTERETRKIVRKSLVAARDLLPGELLGESDIVLRRATNGLPDSARASLLGRKLVVSVPAGATLQMDVFE